MDPLLKARLYLHGIMPLMEDISELDPVSGEAISKQDLILQFEIWKGPCAYLVIKDGRIRYFQGKSSRCDVRLFFPSAQWFNRMFAGENVMPIILKGFTRLPFLLKRFGILSKRLEYFMEGEAKHADDPETVGKRVRLGLHALLCGMAVVAQHDPDMESSARETPDGTLLIRVLPGGPSGFFSRSSGMGSHRFHAAMGKPEARPNAVMEIIGVDAARRLIDAELNVVCAVCMAREIRIAGNLALIDKAGIFMYRFGRLVNSHDF